MFQYSNQKVPQDFDVLTCWNILPSPRLSRALDRTPYRAAHSLSQYLRMFPRPRLSMLLVLSPAEARPRPSISSCCMGRHWRRERQVRHVRAPSPLMVMTGLWLVGTLYSVRVMTVNTGLAATYLRKHLISLLCYRYTLDPLTCNQAKCLSDAVKSLHAFLCSSTEQSNFSCITCVTSFSFA